MEQQLVSLSFRQGTALLSHADDLVQVVTGCGNKAQQAPDLVSDKCSKLDLKISVEKSKAMAMVVPRASQTVT